MGIYKYKAALTKITSDMLIRLMCLHFNTTYILTNLFEHLIMRYIVKCLTCINSFKPCNIIERFC